MKTKRGLRVGWHDMVSKRNRGMQVTACVPDGWYIHVWRVGRWYALMDLRFRRQIDAVRAAQALTVAGLDTHGAMERADPLEVKRIACEALSW